MNNDITDQQNKLDEKPSEPVTKQDSEKKEVDLKDPEASAEDNEDDTSGDDDSESEKENQQDNGKLIINGTKIWREEDFGK